MRNSNNNNNDTNNNNNNTNNHIIVVAAVISRPGRCCRRQGMGSAGRSSDPVTCSAQQQQKQRQEHRKNNSTKSNGDFNTVVGVPCLRRVVGVQSRNAQCYRVKLSRSSILSILGEEKTGVAPLGIAWRSQRKCRLVQAISETDWPDSRPRD